jgi:hypothetical protein
MSSEVTVLEKSKIACLFILTEVAFFYYRFNRVEYRFHDKLDYS